MFEDKIQCKARELKYNWQNVMDSASPKISGHVSKVIEVHDNVTVFVSECENCGEISLDWGRPGAMTEHRKKLSGFPYDENIASMYSPIKKHEC